MRLTQSPPSRPAPGARAAVSSLATLQGLHLGQLTLQGRGGCGVFACVHSGFRCRKFRGGPLDGCWAQPQQPVPSGLLRRAVRTRRRGRAAPFRRRRACVGRGLGRHVLQGPQRSPHGRVLQPHGAARPRARFSVAELGRRGRRAAVAMRAQSGMQTGSGALPALLRPHQPCVMLAGLRLWRVRVTRRSAASRTHSGSANRHWRSSRAPRTAAAAHHAHRLAQTRKGVSGLQPCISERWSLTGAAQPGGDERME